MNPGPETRNPKPSHTHTLTLTLTIAEEHDGQRRRPPIAQLVELHERVQQLETRDCQTLNPGRETRNDKQEQKARPNNKWCN